jgi:phosphatidylinositol glycan class S
VSDTFKQTPAFIIPQWGGVILFNPTTKYSPKTGAEIFALFRTQLLTLLGVPQLPINVKVRKDESGEGRPLSLWQVDALLRKRARENMKGSIEALTSIIALVEKLENMPVGMDVRGEVSSALEELEKVRMISFHSVVLFSRLSVLMAH